MSNRQSVIVIVTFITLLCTLAAHQFGSTQYYELHKVREKTDARQQVLDHLHIAVVVAETTQRGYLLTDDNWYKAVFLKQLATITEDKIELDTLYSKLDVNSLVMSIDRRIFLLLEIVKLHDNKDKDKERALLNEGEGKKYMESIREETNRLKIKLRDEERDLTNKFYFASSWVSNGLGIMNIIVLVLVGISMIPQSRLKENESSSSR